MKRILFVDDEPEVLDGLRNAVRKYRKEWDATFAPGGEAALALLEERPFDLLVTDQNQLATYDLPYFEWDSVGVEPGTGKTEYQLVNKDVNRSTTRRSVLLKEIVTFDGENFLNIVTHTTKAFGAWTPRHWLTVSTNARIFWGFYGRDNVDQTVFPEGDASAQRNADYLGFDGRYGLVNGTSVKWNLGLNFNLPQGYRLSFFALNLLGDQDNIHAVRWQNMVSNLKQRNLYTTDTRSFEVRAEKEF